MSLLVVLPVNGCRRCEDEAKCEPATPIPVGRWPWYSWKVPIFGVSSCVLIFPDYWAGLGLFGAWTSFEAYLGLHEENSLKMRVHVNGIAT